MQLYKVKLNESHSAESNQVINGYLASFPNELGIYSRGEALKKAKMFGGKIEKHGKNYTITEDSIINLSKEELSPAVMKELEDREVYVDSDDDINEPIYYGDIFATILGEITETVRTANTPEVIDELLVLDNICARYEYVRVM